jgi:hypothetical protein
MKKTSLLLAILGCALLAIGLAHCDIGASTGNLQTTCDGGPEAGCPTTPDPGPSGGW